MKFSTVFHTGTIVAIKKATAKVVLDRIPESECGVCAMAAFCGKDKSSATVEASVPAGIVAVPGAKVRIASEGGARSKANILLLAIPTLAFIDGIIASMLCGTGEAVALGIGAVTCLLCFFLLHFFGRGKRPLWRVTQICD